MRFVTQDFLFQPTGCLLLFGLSLNHCIIFVLALLCVRRDLYHSIWLQHISQQRIKATLNSSVGYVNVTLYCTMKLWKQTLEWSNQRCMQQLSLPPPLSTLTVFTKCMLSEHLPHTPSSLSHFLNCLNKNTEECTRSACLSGRFSVSSTP